MSQENVAYAAGFTAGTVGTIERGVSNPSWGTVRAICDAMDVSIVELAKLVQRLETS
jgi:DNA-binding XRE family transcriptional regulator